MSTLEEQEISQDLLGFCRDCNEYTTPIGESKCAKCGAPELDDDDDDGEDLGEDL